jgi:hypothetical protein
VSRNPPGTPKRLRVHAALLGIFAILVQAILFGWHHHPAHFSVAGQWPALSSPHSGAPLSPAADEDECELCTALHFLTAAPGQFILVSLPPLAASPPALAATFAPHRSPTLSFRARAPPVV